MADMFEHGEAEVFMGGDRVGRGIIRDVQMTVAPVALTEERLVAAIEAVWNAPVLVSGSFTVPLSRRQVRRLRYRMGAGPSWQYPRGL